MKLINICNKFIEFSFYALFLLVPLIFSSHTSELYELNKMWLTWVLTILVATAWTVKMVIMKKIWIQKTPLDIPIALFLISQIISTVFSIDSYTSIWGYYSRFNGGLLSTVSYIVLFYAFLSNFEFSELKKLAKRLLGISLISGSLVALWGLPSHFGYDPTCYIFSRTLDVSCWTADFQPMIRMFSTLGQPDWLGAYLAILSPIVLSFILNSKSKIYSAFYSLLGLLFYCEILFTKSRASLIGFWIADLSFFTIYYFTQVKPKLEEITFKSFKPYLKLLGPLFLLIFLASAIILKPTLAQRNSSIGSPSSQTSGGTESGKIRLLVWQGALETWIHYPLFGSGVETFAYSFYKYKPLEHNLTSEWNYLYNKAHNEYLNYLSTTGIFGLGTYLSVIITFLYLSLKKLLKEERKTDKKSKIVLIGLLGAYVSILVTDFFGFSVVITNLYFFLIPAFSLAVFENLYSKNIRSKQFGNENEKLSFLRKLDILIILVVSVYLIFSLINLWLADTSYALGSNLSRGGEYDKAYLHLEDAVAKAPFEPTFRDELANNDSILAISILSQLSKDDKTASDEANLAQSLARESILLATLNTQEHPNNVVFWKTKVRIFYNLSQVDPRYIKFATDAIKKAQELAPYDVNISYSLGLLYGQEGETQKAIDTLKETIHLKPNFAKAHYALGLYYRELATNSKGQVINQDEEQKAIDELNYILKNIDSNDQEVKDALKLWGAS